jgi:hypothetical protein
MPIKPLCEIEVIVSGGLLDGLSNLGPFRQLTAEQLLEDFAAVIADTCRIPARYLMGQ